MSTRVRRPVPGGEFDRGRESVSTGVDALLVLDHMDVDT